MLFENRLDLNWTRFSYVLGIVILIVFALLTYHTFQSIIIPIAIILPSVLILLTESRKIVGLLKLRYPTVVPGTGTVVACITHDQNPYSDIEIIFNFPISNDGKISQNYKGKVTIPRDDSILGTKVNLQAEVCLALFGSYAIYDVQVRDPSGTKYKVRVK